METIRQAGSPSVDYPRLSYPVDYVRITDAISANGVPLLGFKGEGKGLSVTAIIVQADILERELLTKVLIGCDEEETERIVKFINAAEFQKAILVRRSNTVPTWAQAEQ
ncbi:Inorganic pyrophosphatase [Allobaculum sp. Allo2]|nr:Inorganic pyrophosphatase [Allobaculum sp. Allo2]UNT93374.1 Inorganic pyrophosphatase [Allobaculum sp. Allo2]